MTPAVSVVIPTYRRPAMLSVCLEALVHQHGIAHHYEIIVCDDGPDEATQRVTTSCASRAAARGVRVSYIPVVGTQGPAAARNRGWRAARAPVIAFTDDDTVPDRNWLAAGLAALARWDAWAIAGRIEQVRGGKFHDNQANDQRDRNHGPGGLGQAKTLHFGLARRLHWG